MNWKRFCAALLAALILTLTTAPALAESLHVVNCNFWVSLRERPTTDAPRILKIPLRAMVYRLRDAENGFAFVSYNGNQGYVQAQYLSSRNPQTGEDFSVEMYVANCREYINLRQKANTDAKSLAKLPLGTAVECLVNANDDISMAQVRYTDPETGRKITGYVLREYLSVLPDGECLKSAVLNGSMPGDATLQQQIFRLDELRELERILRAAEPGVEGQCPMGAQLVLTLKNGTRKYLSYATDGCGILLMENGEAYNLTEEDKAIFRSIFKSAFDALEV